VDDYYFVCRPNHRLRAGQHNPQQKSWDPYPFILLNLFLSLLAAIQATVIMMSQHRLDTKDRLRGERDSQVNRRAAPYSGVGAKAQPADEKIDDMGELLRQEFTRPR
jgi:uncharacterized membrane protein